MEKSLATTILYLLILLFCRTVSITGNNPSYHFQQLSIDKGLSQTTVNSILADNKGLIWIGTASGLNCFDHYNMKSYFHEKENAHSLPGNTINFIAEDSLNNIWISTNNGLTLYEKSNDSFLPIEHEGAIISVNSFFLMEGAILFSADDGLYIYDYKEKKLRKETITREDSSLFDPFYIFRLAKDELLLVSLNSGTRIYNVVSGKTTSTHYPIHSNLNAAWLDNEKRLYLSSHKEGIVCYDTDGKQLFHISTQNSKLTNDVVLDIKERDGKLWIATDGGGINIMDKNDPFNISSLIHTPGDMNSLPVNSIKCIYQDNQDNLWAGTVRGGMIGIKEVFMKTYKDVPLNRSGGLSEKSVISIHEDKKGQLWIGTDGGGINRYDPYTDTFKHYPSTYGDKVVSITNYSDTELLVSLYTKGIFLFNKETAKSHPFYIIDKETTIDQCFSSYVNLAYQVTDKWFYFIGKNAISYNSHTGKFSFLKVDGNRLAVGAMKMVCADQQAAYIIRSNKLYEARHGNDTLRVLLSIGQHETIKAVARDKNGIFWIGTEYGFGYFDSQTEEYTKIETKLFNNVSTLLLDEQERLWIGARNMLFSYDLKKKRFASWGESDGYTTNEFIYKYQVSSISDYIYLGGASGLLRINKNISTREEPLPEVRLMDVLLDGNSCGDKLQKGNHRITIPHNHSSVELKVIAIEKDVFRNKLYRYTITGLDKQSTETYNHILSLRMLAPGDYSIQVSCNSKSGEWSDPVDVLHITVTSPWYLRSYAFVTYILLFILLLFWGDYLSRRRRDRKTQWEIQKHTNKINEEKVDFLINISHELRTPLTLIYGPLKRLIEKDSWNSPDELKEQLSSIYKQALDMRNIINMALDLNNLKEIKTSLHKTPQLETPPDPEVFSTDNYSVIIVEDKKELSSFLKESLQALFKNIYVAPNGEEALEIIGRKHPDIIISDIMMPKMNGYELCKKIKGEISTSHIPVILLTARGDLDSTTTGYKLGADAYLTKPFDMELLLTVISNQLKNREAIRLKYKESHLHPVEVATIPTNNLDEEFMLKLNKLIHDNIASRQLDVKFLTTQMGISRTPLYTKLKALTNMGVNDYINMIRVEKASQLLTGSTKTITEISEMVGFEYPRHFSTLFKQIKGIPPSQYRAENGVK